MFLLTIDILFSSWVIHLAFTFGTIYQVMEVWGIVYVWLAMDVLQIFEK
jgi:hypothetical protein